MKSLIHGGERLMALRPEFPLTIQADRTVWLETRHPGYEPARDALARFADLERSAGPIHVYRITPLSIWNAAALGLTAAEILEDLERFSGGQVPEGLREDIRTWMARYGRLRLEMGNGRLWLVADDPALLAWVRAQSVVAPFLAPSGEAEADRVAVEPRARGALKQALLYLGYPVEDMAGYVEGARLDLRLRSTSRTTGEPFRLRPYQEEAVEAFLRAGSGVILLPCGAGKTIVGLGVMARLRTATLIIATSTVAARQWITEILDKTDLSPDQVGEYTGHRKQIRPVTVATYQILTHRPHRDFEEDLLRQFPHFRLFSALDWGLIIYDEVHLLPAPVFRITAQLQARRRLGLTATLVREDGLEREVFALIGPKRYEAPWAGAGGPGLDRRGRVPRDPRPDGPGGSPAIRGRGGKGALPPGGHQPGQGAGDPPSSSPGTRRTPSSSSGSIWISWSASPAPSTPP
jgi:DNA excision repair protein ERCC-3